MSLDDERAPINWGLPEVPPDTIAALELAEKKLFLDNLLAGMGTLPAGLSIGWSPQHIDKVTNEPEMAQIINSISQFKNQSVEYALYRNALTGNVTAQQVWLYNRDPNRWRDTKRVIVESEKRVSIEVIHSVKQSALELLQSHGVQALQPGGALGVIEADVTEDDA